MTISKMPAGKWLLLVSVISSACNIDNTNNNRNEDEKEVRQQEQKRAS